jgi:hypothetical protein
MHERTPYAFTVTQTREQLVQAELPDKPHVAAWRPFASLCLKVGGADHEL